MKPLTFLHQALSAIGRNIAQLILLALALTLYAAPALGGVYLSFLASFEIVKAIGAPGWVFIPVWLILVGLGVFYIWMPCLEGPIKRGSIALLKTDAEAASDLD